MVAVGSDHGGYGLKVHILKYLEDNKYRIRIMAALMLKAWIIPIMLFRWLKR